MRTPCILCERSYLAPGLGERGRARVDQDRPWLLTLHGLEMSTKKSEAIDRAAEKIVTTAYRDACQDLTDVRRAFERAIEAYRARFPHIPSDLAGHAVADILSRCEGQAPADRRGGTARR